MKTRKLFAILLALSLVFSMSAVAFADEENGEENGYENGVNGEVDEDVDAVEEEEAEAGFEIPVPDSVVVSNQPLMVDGAIVEVQPYNIDGANFFKLRDLAALLTGTGSQFNVGFEDGNIVVTTGEEYEALETDLVIGEDESASTRPSPQTLVVDGEVVSEILVYNIGGSNYFQLRELGAIVGFAVDYDAETRTVIVETEGYEPAEVDEDDEDEDDEDEDEDDDDEEDEE